MRHDSLLAPNFCGIPDQLKAIPRWVVWQLTANGSKLPFSPGTGRPISVTEANYYCDFESAKAAYSRGKRFTGVGFVFNGDGLTGIDIDGCIDNGQINPAAINLLENLGCGYIEISPSGRGLHGYGYTSAVGSGTRGRVDGLMVEIYSKVRYFTVTGNHVHGTALPQINTLRGIETLSNRVTRRPPTQETQDTQDTQGTQDIHLTKASAATLQELFANLPGSAIPKEFGMRNTCVFQLARYVKGVVPEATQDELYTIVSHWFETFKTNIRTQDLSVTWVEFQTAWAAVLCPRGNVLNEALSQPCDLPPQMRDHRYGPKGERLLTICCQLARHHAPAPFFLSARQAGELISLDYSDAAKFLKVFCLNGFIRCVEQGTRSRAASYILCHPELTEQEQEEYDHD